MKKVLSLVLVIAMVLSCFTVAFAAPKDVTDANQIKAIDALVSLGVVNGYPDGTYRPNGTITRAEMTKLLVEALGHGDLAQGSSSSFKDAKGKWYDGYVAMAAGLDIVNGYPDGTFKGDSAVTYQEAIVMTLRALGYTNSAVNGGNSAYNASKYKALGASLGLLKNITFKNGGANRGDIAVMVYNALEVETVQINDKGLAQKIEVERITVPVEGRPGVTKVEIVYEVLLDRIAERDTINVSANSLDSSSKDYLGNTVDLAPYMYQNITVYKNEDGDVIFVKRVNSTTVSGTVSAIEKTDIQWSNVANQTKVFVKKADGTVEKVQFNKTAGATIPVYLNGGTTTATLADLQIKGSLDGAEITLVLNSDDVITHAVAKQATKTAQMTKAYKEGSTVLGSLSLPKNGSKVDLTKVTVTGDVTAIEDIVKGDVVTAYNAAGVTGVPAKTELVVSRDTVEGKITATKAGGYVINGDTYYYSGNDSVAVGDEGTFYLDCFGDIFAFEGKSIGNANYALITSIKAGVSVGSELIKEAEMKLLNKDGKVTAFNFDKDAVYVLDGKDAKAVFTNELQAYDTTFAGFRANNYVVTGYELNNSDEIVKIAVKTLTTQTVNPASKTFVAADDVVIFNVYNGEFTVASVEDLLETSKSYNAVLNNKGEFELIIATDKLVNDSNYAIITGVESVLNDNNQTVKKVIGYMNGEKVEFLTSVGVTLPAAADYRAKLFALPLSNGVISSSITTPFAPQASNVTSSAISAVNASKGTFTLDGARKALADNAVVYVYEQSATTGNDAFVRIGDISDLELENAKFDFYNTNATTDTTNEVYEVVIVRIQR